MRVPLAASDFASYLLQAQSSGAQVLALANAGSDFTNSLRAAEEFGLLKTMRPAALLAFISDIHALGLETAQGLYLTAAWYWDLNDKSRAFAKRFFDKAGAEPTMTQAGYYSATLTYLNAVKAAGATDADKVMNELRKTKIDDMFTDNGVIRADGLMQHDMYVMQVKKPSESKYAWDYYRVVKKISGEQAFGKLADSTCPLPRSEAEIVSTTGSRRRSVDFTRSHAPGMTAICVRREKAALSSGCKSHPANAPAGSNRSSHGGNEMAEAFGVAGHI